MTLPKEFKGAILSEGTMRTEDLIVSFSAFLVNNKWLMTKAVCKKIDSIIKRIDNLLFIADSFGRSRLDDGCVEEASEVLWLEIAWLLNQIAPDDCYFGSHIGDGACYGFFDIDDLSF